MGDFTLAICPHSPVTALQIQKDYILIVCVDGCVYKVDFAGSVKDIVRVDDAIWNLTCQDHLVVLGGATGKIYLHNIKSGITQTNLSHSAAVRCVQFINATTLISGSRDCTMMTWDIGSGTLQHKADFIGHTAVVKCLQTHQDIVVSGSYDGDARIWNGQTGECLRVLHGHRGPIYFIQFDGTKIITSSADREIRVWDVQGYCTAVLDASGGGGSNLGIPVPRLNLAGDVLVNSTTNGSIRSWSLASSPPRLHSTILSDIDDTIVALDVNDRYVVSGSVSGMVFLGDYQSGELIARWKLGDAVFQVGLISEDQLVAVYSKAGATMVTFCNRSSVR